MLNYIMYTCHVVSSDVSELLSLSTVIQALKEDLLELLLFRKLQKVSLRAIDMW